jgi:(p)ppGpp synthase/HD superfamily hydrolase
MAAHAIHHDEEIHLSKRFFKATEWAAERHAARPRRGPTTPSLGQVLGIASLVLEDGGIEREAIAAMVLDAVGDDELPLAELRSRFGKKVARLLDRCARERAAGIDGRVTRLETEDDVAVRRVLAADTLRELRELVADLRRAGSITFARFDARPVAQLERYEATVQALTRRDPMGPLSDELRATCAEMRRLVEVDTATAAWRVAHSDTDTADATAA